MRYLSFLLLLLALLACEKKEAPSEAPSEKTCTDCHAFELDQNHAFGCKKCHAGKSPASDKETAHQGLIASPAAPAHWEKTCGSCHAREIAAVKESLHFTLAKEVNTVRRLFDLPPVAAASDLPEPVRIETTEDLVDDLLRRRCLRCHLFYRGDDYAETQHGLGCAACHLPYAGGEMISHKFQGPNDRLCLHCHYGNRVGWDYYGMAEHDYPYQFRSPLIEGEPPPRPWGVEFHELSLDVHLEAGMSCLSCHGKEELMFSRKRASCRSCHKLSPQSPYHRPEVLRAARCSACHARWAFWDEGLYLVLHETPDWEEWSELMVQGSSEVEEAITSFLLTGEAEARMRDKFSGRERQGIWLLTLKRRRFEKVVLGRDEKGRVSVVRPLGDLYLSYVDAEEDVPFDNLTPEGDHLLPYAPHTIGKADFARSQEVLRLLGVKP